jgi:hypothetical protein
MASEQGFIVDGFASLAGGMNSGIAADLLPVNQVSYSVNTTYRGGFIRARPKYRQIKLDFQDETEAQDWFNKHPITGSSYYTAANGTKSLVCASGGRFFQIRINANIGTVSEITPASGRMSQFSPITYFCQAAQFLVAQDGVGIPFIFDGATGRFASYADAANPEVPTGKQMAYINDRLFVVSPNSLQILPGDLVSVTPTSVITFSEILMAAADGGQPLNIPVNEPITCLIPTAQTNTLAGQGVLLACTRGTVCSINPIIQRNLWPTIQLQNVALIGNGFTSQGCVSVNADVWGRSIDGWRSYVMASQEFGQWGNTPQSYEIQRILEKDSTNLLDHADFVYFDNRLIGTVSPVAIGNGVYHRGLAVIDFVNSSSLTSKANPDYDGLWTGINPYNLVTGEFDGEERCFAFCYESSTEKTLWEITKEYGDDNDTTRIPCLVETRAMTFKNATVAQNQYFGIVSASKYLRLETGELWVDQMRGQVDFDVKYRPDQSPCWFDWKCFTKASKEDACDETPLDPMACVTPQTFEDQYRPRIALGQPPDKSEPILGKPSRFGYEFQFRIQWTGNCRLRVGRFYATQRDENPWTLTRDGL